MLCVFLTPERLSLMHFIVSINFADYIIKFMIYLMKIAIGIVNIYDNKMKIYMLDYNIAYTLFPKIIYESCKRFTGNERFQDFLHVKCITHAFVVKLNLSYA